MAPKVSVIVPVYNVERYVEQCLRSLMRQTLQDMEVIVVDDGSTDRSGEICDTLAAMDSRFRVLHRQNAGYGAAVNAGFAEARGEYLGILESDDFCDIDAFELLYNAVHEADADFAKAQFFFYWGEEERREAPPFFEEKDCGRVLCPLDVDYVFNLKPSIWSGIYKADFLKEKGISLHETPGASYQDASFNFQVLSLAERAVLLEERLFFYRQDNEGSSVNSRDKAFVIFDEYAYMEKFLEAHADHPRIERLWQLLALLRHDVYMWNYFRVNPSYHVDVAKRMAEDFKRDLDAGRYAFDLINIDQWVNIHAICDDPVHYVDLFDNGARTARDSLREKAVRARYISGKEGLGTYLGRAFSKYVLRRG